MLASWKKRARQRALCAHVRRCIDAWIRKQRAGILISRMEHMTLTHGRTMRVGVDGQRGTHDVHIARRCTIDADGIGTQDNVRVQLEPIRKGKGIGAGYRSPATKRRMLLRYVKGVTRER